MKTRFIAQMGMVAAIYAALTVAIAPIAFGPFQFRIAESLNLLAFFNPIFAPAVAIGVLVANLLSPYGIIDVILGTSATILALLLILATKKLTNSLLLASLWPTIVNALVIPIVIIIGMAEGFAWASYWFFVGSVGFGQFVVVTLFGYTLCRVLMAKYPKIIEALKLPFSS